MARREADVLFDGTYEGFLCVVYAYYYEGIHPVSIGADTMLQPTIMLDEFYVVTAYEKARKVDAALTEKISPDAARRVRYAFFADAADRYAVLLHYIVLGFKMGHVVDSYLQQDVVLRVHKLAREVGGEAHRLTGFCRFAETKQGIYYCAVTPKHFVLPFLAEHFTDRLMNQSWIIHDTRRGKAVVYDGEAYIFVDATEAANLEYAANEGLVQDLWVMYFNTAAIEARKNKKLHKKILPLRYRWNMLEFASESAL